MIVPWSDEWSFANLPTERRRYLDDDMLFEAIAEGSLISLLWSMVALTRCGTEDGPVRTARGRLG